MSENRIPPLLLPENRPRCLVWLGCCAWVQTALAHRLACQLSTSPYMIGLCAPRETFVFYQLFMASV